MGWKDIDFAKQIQTSGPDSEFSNKSGKLPDSDAPCLVVDEQGC